MLQFEKHDFEKNA